MIDQQARSEVVVAAKVSDCVVRIANEPTVGLYYVQEHVRAAVPGIIETQETLLSEARNMQTFCIDADLALQSVRSMVNPVHFTGLFSTVNQDNKTLRVRVALLEHKLRDF
jgi:hypothetical protein